MKLYKCHNYASLILPGALSYLYKHKGDFCKQIITDAELLGWQNIDSSGPGFKETEDEFIFLSCCS